MHTTTHRIGIQWILGAAALLAAAGVQASCFTVYNARGHMVQRSAEPPVNMAYQLHQTVPRRFGRGASMVFENSTSRCIDYENRRSVRLSRHGGAHARDDTNSILDDMASAYRGSAGYRTDTWLADVKLNGSR